jgi:hypothetical protein
VPTSRPLRSERALGSVVPLPCPPPRLTLRPRSCFGSPKVIKRRFPFGPEAEAVFRLLKHPNRDIFEFADGKQITLDYLPAGLIFDVLLVPGSEQLSAVLNMEPAEHDEEEREKESLIGRLLAHF